MNISSFLFSLFLITTFLGCDEPKKEVEAPQNEATSEDRLFVIDDATLGVDAKGLLTAAWVVEGAAGSIASFEAVIGKNQDCSEVEEQLSIESEQNSLSYQFKNSGVFYLCMFATTSDEQKIAASNNGLKIEVKLPVEISKLESQVHQTQVDWVQPEGLLTFNLEASKTIDFDADVKLVESVKSPFVYAELEPEAEYFFRLSTIVGEDVAVSAIKSIKTLPLPVVPENFALQAGNASLEVSWDFKPDHTYEVHYADNINLRECRY